MTDRRHDPVDLADPEPGTVRRSEGGFTEPLPAPERAQDGDMSIPELGHQDPRYEGVEVFETETPEAPWAGWEANAKRQLTAELAAAAKAALRASKWAKILADVDDETTTALRDVAERLRGLDEGFAKGPR